MKKVGVVCLVIFCIFAMLCPGMSVFAQEQEQAPFGCYSVDAKMALLGNADIIDNAESAFLYETNSKTLMYAWNADVQTEPASFVKIMTAYIAIENGNLEDPVTVQDSALNILPADAVSAELVSGEVLTLEDLLHCMLVGSANDAATVIAEHIAGSQDAFVEMMNTVACELGCNNTYFVNATGLFDERQLTTARDSARILEAAMENDDFRRIFYTAEYYVPATNKSEERHLVTGNYLIANNQDYVSFYVDERVMGGRTGITQSGKRVVASVAEADGLELICIVMGAESVLADNGYSVKVFGGYQETTALLDAGFKNKKVSQVLYSNQALTQQSVAMGECDVVLGPQISVFAVLDQDVQIENLTYRYSHAAQGLEAPIEKGDVVSTVEVWNGGICVAQADLYAMNSVTVQSQLDQQASTERNGGSLGKILLTILISLAVLIFVIFIYRYIRISIAKNKSRRKRHNRRRSY